MAQIDRSIATYLSAVETEGKAWRMIKSYRGALTEFRRVGRRLSLPETVGECEVSHVYAFLADVRQRRGRSGCFECGPECVSAKPGAKRLPPPSGPRPRFFTSRCSKVTGGGVLVANISGG